MGYLYLLAHSMQVKVGVTVHCPSICLSIGLSVPSWSAAGLLLWAGRQEISIDCCSGSLWWAESWTQSCINWPLFCKVMGDNMVDFLECPVFFLHQPALSALTLLVGHHEEHPAYKNWVMRCWYSYLSGARCRLCAYDPAEATASQNHISCLI